MCQFHVVDGTGEFLVAWLMLVEKMVNPDPLFSPTYSYTNFRQLEYMKKTHKVSRLLLLIHEGPLLLTWFNFNPGMDK